MLVLFVKTTEDLSSDTPMRRSDEVAAGERFEFGANWTRFLKDLDDERIREAEQSLRNMLQLDSLAGMSFIDAGCGSGLFSLAARRLGARVHSFDYDPKSVACARELKQRYFPQDTGWKIDEASVLDPGYPAGLGQFDVVYSWGVPHHTGHMWPALDQGKRLYNRLPAGFRFLVLWPAFRHFWWRRLLKDLLFSPSFPLLAGIQTDARHVSLVGCSGLGGYPF